MRGRRFVVLAICLALISIPALSWGRALLRDDGLSFMGKSAAWARNHGLSPLVDVLERWRYGDAPSSTPAGKLTGGSTGTRARVGAPEDLAVLSTRPLEGEGKWHVARRIGAKPVVWTTGLRPSAKFPSIVASYAVFDQRYMRAVLHNGTEVPGGSNWIHGNKVSPDERRDLVFAFNGGFRGAHSAGGYFTEGRLLWRMRDGAATLAIDRNGILRMGIWGRDPGFSDRNLTSWTSVRQNLLPLLIDGVPNPELRNGYWGGGGKGEIYVLRSGICERRDGRMLYVISGPTDATTLASTMRDAGCTIAMQLDQNESYPRGYVYTPTSIVELDERMAGHPDDYVKGSLREFFAMFAR